MKAGSDAVSLFLRQQLLESLESRLLPIRPDYCSSRMADVGCGYGYWLQNFVDMSFPSSQVFGLDGDLARLRDSSARPDASNVICGDARHLPWPTRTFDMVSQFTVFSSVLLSSDREQISREMLRVLKPGGLVIWYDFFAPNLRNRKTRAIGKRELMTLFPGCPIQIQRVTLAPPLARLALRISHRLARTLGTISLLCTHYLALITCPGPTAVL